MFNRMSTLEERFFSVPLRVQTESSLVPASSYPRMVRVSLRGEPNSIIPILEDDIEAYLDLTAVKTEGAYSAAVKIRKKGTAIGVDPLEVTVDPMEISINMEEKLTKTVPISAQFRGSLESGYELSAYSLEPSSVEISGPRGLVETVRNLETEYIELSGRKEDFSANPLIVNLNNLITVHGSGQSAFRGTVRQAVMNRVLDRVPLVISGLMDGLVARPAMVYGSVQLQGAESELSSYIPDASLLSADCTAVDSPGVFTVPLIVSAPAHFVVIRYEPMSVEVSAEAIELDPPSSMEEGSAFSEPSQPSWGEGQ